jgi:sugar O-acyltransferase (sialic acid O-acetyltransferase NeuD family)
MSQGIIVRGFLDDSPGTRGYSVIGIPVLGAINRWAEYAPDGLVLGIGSNVVRQHIIDRLGDSVSGLWRNAIHPRAIVSSHVTLGCDVVIVAGAVVNVSSVIGSHVIINTSASIDHDCVIGDYAHIAPGAHLAGGVSVGEGTLIGIGAVVTPGCTIGKWAIVGAGAVVVRDIPDGVTAKGVPARW